MSIDVILSQLPASVARYKANTGAVVMPTHASDVQEIMALANAYRQPVSLNKQPDDNLTVDLSGLNRIIRHRPEEMMVTTEAGITVKALNDALAPYQQRLSHTYAPERTLFSILSELTPSLSDTAQGSIRPRVLGLQVVTGDGIILHTGGEVVKNVTGYAMQHLFLGTHNHYGVMTQATLKLNAIAPLRRAFLFEIDNRRQALDIYRQFGKRLSSADILSIFRFASEQHWYILLGLAGYTRLVEADIDTMHTILSDTNADLQELFLAPRAVEYWIKQLDWFSTSNQTDLVLLACLNHKSMMDLPYFVAQTTALHGGDMQLAWNCNRALLRWDTTHIPTLTALESLCQMVQQHGGFITCAYSCQAELTRWFAQQQTDHSVITQWTHRLKAQLDPNGILPALPAVLEVVS